MKNLMLFIHPSKDFMEEQKTAIKIEIDNSLSLGWQVCDIILATNFPYEYRGVKSLLVSDKNYCNFCPTVSIINVIVELFDRKLIKKGELYWYHDTDTYQLYKIKESELDLDKVDIALIDRGTKPKMDTGIIFFKKSTEDIFRKLKDTCYQYQVNEEYALMALYTNNLLWITEPETTAQVKFSPLNRNSNNLQTRFKKLNQRYNFGVDSLDLIYKMAVKPIKIVHFHFSIDLLLDSAMYGKNSLKKPILPKRLIKIFKSHGVEGTHSKKIKNLMIYLNPEKKFPIETESLVKRQIESSLKIGWKKTDIILLTNFPYQYQGIKAMTTDSISKSDAILHLLQLGVVKEAELWWYHDLKIFQLHPIDSSQIDLSDNTAGFINTDNFFFRKGSHKLFEWIRNRAVRLKVDEAAALTSLSITNYRNINSMYTTFKKVI